MVEDVSAKAASWQIERAEPVVLDLLKRHPVPRVDVQSHSDPLIGYAEALTEKRQKSRTIFGSELANSMVFRDFAPSAQ